MMVLRLSAFWATLIGIAFWASAVAFALDFGQFKGRLVTEALDDGRNLRVVEDFTYVDGKGEDWPVPKGTKTDGASVPRFFWQLFPPFSGKHRIAAVVHDRFCQTRDRTWRLVHRMFYDAMRAAGVNIASASAMYAAVYAFGPRWSLIGTDRSISLPEISEREQVKSFRAIQAWIEESNPSPEAIAQRIRSTGVRELGSEAFN